MNLIDDRVEPELNWGMTSQSFYITQLRIEYGITYKTLYFTLVHLYFNFKSLEIYYFLLEVIRIPLPCDKTRTTNISWKYHDNVASYWMKY